MPEIWRGMKTDGELPELGSSASCLGVRIGNEDNDDISAANGEVQPGQGGMSVSPTAESIPPHRIPRRLRQQYRKAIGTNNHSLWRMGEGAFVASPVTDSLLLRPDPDKPSCHGFVEPSATMTIADYVAAICATRELWVREA